MEQPSFGGSRRRDEPDFDLKEWALKARISRENANSRRFSASNLKSFREDTKSSRSNFNISSTASSPGYTIKEIDPSTYSFTTALKALQAKTVYTWEYLSPEGGLKLNSKWNDAEKYISNPLSGEVPLECLSAETLSGRSFRSITNRITMSAPLIYPSNLQQFQTKPPLPVTLHEPNEVKITIQEEKKSNTNDVGTESMPKGLSSGGPSPVHTPSIEERSIKQSETETVESIASSGKSNPETEVSVTETRNEVCVGDSNKKERKLLQNMCRCKGGCISLRGLWSMRDDNKKKNNKQKPSNSNSDSDDSISLRN